MKHQLLLLCFLQAYACYSQIIHPAINTGPHYPGAYSLHFTDAFSFTNNQSALANTTVLSAGISTERKFMLHELSSYSCAIAIPVRAGGIGIVIIQTGSANFSESQAGVAYAKKLGKIDLGIQFNYAMIRLSNYGHDGAVTIEVGTTWHITQNLHTGIHIINPQGGWFSKNRREKLASVFAMGMGYEVSDQLLVQAEIVKEEAKPVNIRTAIEYIPVKGFIAVAGINTAPASPFFGAGWQQKYFRTDIVISYHLSLGVTPGIRIIFYGKKQ